MKKCYSLREPVLQTLFCTFYNNPHGANVDALDPQVLKYCCLMSRVNLKSGPFFALNCGPRPQHAQSLHSSWTRLQVL